MSNLNDPNFEDYKHRWQCWLALRSCAAGRPNEARMYISKLRAMRRRLLRTGKLTARQRLNFMETPGRWRYPYRWLIQRNLNRFDNAFKRAETQRTMVRRGLFDPMGLHRDFRGVTTRRTRDSKRHQRKLAN